MKIRFLPVAILAALVMAFAGFVSACFGDGQLTLEEYFEELEQLSEDFNDEGDDVGDTLEEELEDADDDDEEVEAYQEFFDEAVSLFAAFRDDLDGLNPPDEAEREHENAVEAATALLELLDEFAEEAEDADDASDVEELFFDDDFDEATEDFDEACRDLQDVSDDEDIDVDLECEDESDDFDFDEDDFDFDEDDFDFDFDEDDFGDTFAVEDYFFEIEPLVVTFGNGIVDLTDQFLLDVADVTTTAEGESIAAEFYDNAFVLADDLAFELEFIDPPSDVLAEHLELLDSTIALADTFDELFLEALDGILTAASWTKATASTRPASRFRTSLTQRESSSTWTAWGRLPHPRPLSQRERGVARVQRPAPARAATKARLRGLKARAYEGTVARL